MSATIVPVFRLVLLISTTSFVRCQTFTGVHQAQLSPQQQGQILSDVQQHQHRFQLQQNNPFLGQTSHVNGFNQQSLASSFNPAVVTQQPVSRAVQPSLHQQQLINQYRTQQQNARPQVVQHHTQTGFIPLAQQSISQPLLDVPSDTLLSPQQNLQLQKYLEEQRQQQRLKELREKQKIVEKHQQFVEKQYEKALQKAKKEHEEFLVKQRESREKLESLVKKPETNQNTQPRARPVLPHESSLFQAALSQYFKEHPTNPPTSTTTESASPKPGAELEDPTKFLQGKRQKLFTELKNSLQKEKNDQEVISSLSAFLPTALPKLRETPNLKPTPSNTLSTEEYSREELIRHLKQAIAKEPLQASTSKNVTSREINLPNGQTVEIIRTSDPSLIPGAKALSPDGSNIVNQLSFPSSTLAPPKQIFEDLTKSVIPPGANFELIKHTQNGIEKVEEIPKHLSGHKKVTFVLLEEQNDGSYKVQGVRGNSDKGKEDPDVDSILKKIKEGEIKLPPPSTKIPVTPTLASIAAPNPKITFNSNPNQSVLRPTRDPTYVSNSDTNKSDVSSKTNRYVSASTPRYNTTPGRGRLRFTEEVANTASQNVISSTTPYTPFSPTVKSTYFNYQTPTSTVATSKIPQFHQEPARSPSIASVQSTPYQPQNIFRGETSTGSAFSNVFVNPTTVASVAKDGSNSFPTAASNGLITILKNQGLYAMAKFLKQSGLDTILNETGPYTIFVPTDKAFRTLLVQLGGPEKAEEKFKENPRLLSGLLLHHVIPGAFEITSLQDEMTGVSLAGTQLRVNQYNMHDVEWNEVKITTINGAKVLTEKQDIQIPQGIAHAVDRVMFPLPVGDIIQTLQSDRERKFTTFLRAIYSSGMADTLQGSKTFTMFAPTDKAFEELPTEEITRLVTDKELAQELVMRHVMSGTMFTSGMRYYQVRDSLQPGKQITLNKNTGRLKVNNNSIVTQNIPATNGVIHTIEALL